MEHSVANRVNIIRATVTAPQRGILDQAWRTYTQSNGTRWPSMREILIPRKPAEVSAAIGGLEPGSAFIEQDWLQLTLLGVLLASDGPVVENNVIAFLEWLQRCAHREPAISLVKSDDMPGITAMAEEEYRDLAWAVRLLEIHEGYHAPGGGRWHLRVSGEIANIAHTMDLREYLHDRALGIAHRIAAARSLFKPVAIAETAAHEASQQITEVTRREIVHQFTADKVNWAGRLDEHDFLSRLYDLNVLPSNDDRFATAARDIWHHQVFNSDWDHNWVFHDQRFNLLYGGDSAFLQFLCQTVDPVVRPSTDEAKRLVTVYNRQLCKDGWELFQKGEISGRPVFAARKTTTEVVLFEEPTGWPKVDRQVDEIRLRVQEAKAEEQFQTVGHLCREALISVAQAVYDRRHHPPLDGEPSSTDAKRILADFFAVALAGSGKGDARKHARAAFDLANDVQHDRGATFLDAALCAEATLSVIRIVAIVSGRRQRTESGS